MGEAPLSTARRTEILEQEILDLAADGWRVEARTKTQAIVAQGHEVNHLLHLLATFLLCTLWLPVWIIVALTGGEQRAKIAVDTSGLVDYEQEPESRGLIALCIVAGVVWVGIIIALIIFALN